MLLNLIATTITFRTLPGLNKVLNEPNSVNYGTTIIETKMNYIIYTRIAAVVLLLTVLVSLHIISLTFFNINYDAFIIDYTSLTLSTNLIPSAPKTAEEYKQKYHDSEEMKTVHDTKVKGIITQLKEVIVVVSSTGALVASNSISNLFPSSLNQFSITAVSLPRSNNQSGVSSSGNANQNGTGQSSSGTSSSSQNTNTNNMDLIDSNSNDLIYEDSNLELD